MLKKMHRSLARAAFVAALALPAAAVLAPASTPFSASQAEAGIIAEHKQTLAKFGTFVEHAKYGEVWIPSVTPQGWHPYPACNWVYTKYGWHFDDKTAWGEIVHHYGRWAHDAKLGWVWVAGEEFSPAWVVWKTNDKWVGWAPMLPEQDLTTVSATDFNNDKLWTFMEADKFGKACGGIAPAQQVPMLLTQTKVVKEFVFVDGIMVFVLGPKFIGPFIHITINFNPWSPFFIANIVNGWNVLWNAMAAPAQQIACGPVPQNAQQPQNAAPPGPPKRTDAGPQGLPQSPPIVNAGIPQVQPLPLPLPGVNDHGRPWPGKGRPHARPDHNNDHDDKGKGGDKTDKEDKNDKGPDHCRLLGQCGDKGPGKATDKVRDTIGKVGTKPLGNWTIEREPRRPIDQPVTKVTPEVKTLNPVKPSVGVLQRVSEGPRTQTTVPPRPPRPWR